MGVKLRHIFFWFSKYESEIFNNNNIIMDIKNIIFIVQNNQNTYNCAYTYNSACTFTNFACTFTNFACTFTIVRALLLIVRALLQMCVHFYQLCVHFYNCACTFTNCACTFTKCACTLGLMKLMARYRGAVSLHTWLTNMCNNN